MNRNVARWMAVLVVASLAACNRGERTSVTSSYGQGVVAGQVTMAAGLGSPEGVDVSVRGTGMRTLLAADGQFTFAGVPSGAALDFRRSSDGVNASLSLSANQSFVNVSLGKTAARSFKRGGNELQLEGIVRSISATELVMVDSRLREQTVQLTANTLIRKGSATVAPADVRAGWRVRVKATRAEDVYTAVQVVVQDRNGGDDEGEGDGRGAGLGREYEGLVTAASATSLSVATSRTGVVVFALTGETVIRKGNTILTAADLHPDDRVHVKASTGTDGAKTARLVIVQNQNDDDGDDDGGEEDAPGVREFEGTVRTATASSLVVFTSHREEVTFAINAATEIRRGNERLTAADLKADMRVHVKAKAEGTTNTAVRITVQKNK